MSNTLLPARESFINSLSTVCPSSASSPCPICTDPYDAVSTQPVLVQSCGHIFCRSCITTWLNNGNRTCPLDRRVLFASPESPLTHGRPGSWVAEEDFDDWHAFQWSRRNAVFPTSIEQYHSSGIRDGPRLRNDNYPFRRQRRNAVTEGIEADGSVQETPEYIIVNDEILAINGYWTRRGCRHFVRDWFERTAVLARGIARGQYDIATVPLTIPHLKSSLHLGIVVPEVVWRRLLFLAHSMLRWHSWGQYPERYDWDSDELCDHVVEDVVDEVWEVVEQAYER